MVSPGLFLGVFFFFFNLIFRTVSGVKGQRMAQNDKKLSVMLHMAGTIHHMILINGTLV